MQIFLRVLRRKNHIKCFVSTISISRTGGSRNLRRPFWCVQGPLTIQDGALRKLQMVETVPGQRNASAGRKGRTPPVQSGKDSLAAHFVRLKISRPMREAVSMMAPAKRTPPRAAMVLFRKSMSRMLAASMPVQAPVPGSGMPTKRKSAQ